MAKFYDVVGYVEQIETAPGVFEEKATEIAYQGDITKNTTRWQTGEGLNDDLTVSNIISIVADPYAEQHVFAIRYVKWMGAYWKVTNVEVQRPRLILTIGGRYNGKTAGTA